MTTFIVRRLLMTIIVLLLVSLLVFMAMRLLPGDPIRMIITQSEQQEFTPEMINDLKKEFGLDKPLPVQYINWIGGIFQGDFGKSILQRIPVSEEIFRRLPITLHIGITSFIFGVLIGVPFGVICAIRRGKLIDSVLTSLANIGITVPAFWLGLMLIYFFGLKLDMLPVQGYTSPFSDFGMSAQQLIMPVFCMMLYPIASNTRQTRSSMLEVMRQDYIRTAWSKGLKERSIVIRHALKNGLIPVVTISGMQLSFIIGGSVVVETVFNIPGMGRLAVTSIQNQDYPYVQGIILISATVVMLVNLLVDLIYGWIDPRIRYN